MFTTEYAENLLTELGIKLYSATVKLLVLEFFHYENVLKEEITDAVQELRHVAQRSRYISQSSGYMLPMDADKLYKILCSVNWSKTGQDRLKLDIDYTANKYKSGVRTTATEKIVQNFDYTLVHNALKQMAQSCVESNQSSYYIAVRYIETILHRS